MSHVVFEDPPDKTATWRDRLAPVMERPGEWARVWPVGRSYSYRVLSALQGRSRSKKCRLPPGRWEFRVGRVGGQHYVFALYRGPGGREAGA